MSQNYQMITTTTPGVFLLSATGLFKMLSMIDPSAISHYATAVSAISAAGYYCVMLYKNLKGKKRNYNHHK